MRAFAGLALILLSMTSLAASEDLVASAEMQVEQSLQQDHSPFMHAMRSPREQPGAARQKINAWIRFNFRQAFAAKDRGDTEAALVAYLTARHALRDATSPASNDSKGNPAVLRANAAPVHKEYEKHLWRDRVDEDTKAMFDNGIVPSGDLLSMYGIDSETGPIDRPHQVPRPSIGNK